MTAASEPSASAQAAPDCTPTSLSSVLTGTPDQLLVLVSPCSDCAVLVSGPSVQAVLPEHSRNMIRLIEGMRCRSATV